MNNPLYAFFQTVSAAADAAVRRSRAGSIEAIADREEELLAGYRKAEQAFLALIDQLQRETNSTEIDNSFSYLRDAIKDNSPAREWGEVIEALGAGGIK